MTKHPHTPLVLIILDGFGHRESSDHNAIAAARTPNIDWLYDRYPHTTLSGSGADVGLPGNQMGNSEVGHLNMGAGRVIYQDLTRIQQAIKDGSFAHNPVFMRLFETLKQNQRALHIFGLVSPGGVHSHEQQIQALINSEKDETELTMCTDVDRNDKSRICVPGTVKVIGRRQIEMYSKLIHTVDHVEGQLAENFDSIDAFITHMWVVTVTGAPKLWAMQFIENHETSPRQWYGGAVGIIHFNGDINTGLTIRTVEISQGYAKIQAGATLLYDSDPSAEEAETELKASALLSALKPVKGL
jgi:hypothetical protein